MRNILLNSVSLCVFFYYETFLNDLSRILKTKYSEQGPTLNPSKKPHVITVVQSVGAFLQAAVLSSDWLL